MLKETYSGDEMILNMGPQHPSTHGVLRVELLTDGEVVKQATPHIGYLHRCFEKHAENVDWQGVIPYTDRLDYVAAMNNALGYCLTVEKLMKLEVGERVSSIRIIMAELNRIASHLLAIGTYGIDIGTYTPFLHAFREREKILDLFEWVCGARLLYNYPWIGGVSHDLPEGFVSECRAFLDQFGTMLDETRRLLTENGIFIRRTAEVGIIPAGMAIDYGLSGPNLRGSGVAFDVRKDEPYLGYEDFEFDVVVGQGIYGPLGSCWDRYYVRMVEMEQSMRIIRQALERLPEEDVHAKVPKRVRVPKGDVFLRTETPRGELSYYIVSDGKPKPYRVKVRSPGFCAMSLFHEISEGALIADIVAIIGSLDIVLGEVDR